MLRVARTKMFKALINGNIDEHFIKYYKFANWILLLLMAVVANVVSSLDIVTGILAGGFIANLNCIGLERDCKRMVRWHTVIVYYGGLAVRLGLITLAVTAAFLIFPKLISPIGFFIGLSVMVINFYILLLAMVIHRVCFKEAV
ncbi:MAG: ATP synthase subunit I [Dissulfuribacterales bacterium]